MNDHMLTRRGHVNMPRLYRHPLLHRLYRQRSHALEQVRQPAGVLGVQVLGHDQGQAGNVWWQLAHQLGDSLQASCRGGNACHVEMPLMRGRFRRRHLNVCLDPAHRYRLQMKIVAIDRCYRQQGTDLQAVFLCEMGENITFRGRNIFAENCFFDLTFHTATHHETTPWNTPRPGDQAGNRAGSRAIVPEKICGVAEACPSRYGN